MADPTTPQTPIPNFSLNLDPHTEPVSPVTENTATAETPIETPIAVTIDLPEMPSVPETSVVSENKEEIIDNPNAISTPVVEDDRLKQEDQLVEEAKEEPIQIETPTVEVPVTETAPAVTIDLPEMPSVPETSVVSENKEEIIDNPNAISTPIEDTPAPEVQTEISTPTAETPISISPEEVKTEVVVQEDPIQESTETQAETMTQNTPETPSLSKDMEIIKNIQNTNSVANATPPVNTVTPSSTVDSMPKIPANNSFNLDSIQVQIPQVAQAPASIVPPPAPSPIPANPYDNLQKIIPQIAPTAISGPATKENNMTKMLSVGATVVFLVLAWFVIKTMYPIQYRDFVSSITGSGDEDTISTELSGSENMLEELPGSGDMLSGDMLSGDNVLLGSGNSLLEGTDTENLSGTSLSGDSTTTGEDHSVAPTEDANTTAFKTKLQTYSSQGKDAYEKAKISNDKVALKYALSLYKKADGYLQELANGDQITTDKMNSIDTELSAYLTKVAPEQTNATPEEIPQTNTSSDFNPEAFFSDSGSTSN